MPLYQVDYRICRETTVTELEVTVNQYLENGYMLYGNPFVQNSLVPAIPHWCQAVVKMYAEPTLQGDRDAGDPDAQTDRKMSPLLS